MGLIEEEIKEIRQLMKHYDAGKVTDEQLHIKIALYSQTEKRARLVLQAFNLSAKYGKKSLNKLLRTNLIGNGVAIDLTVEEIQEEKLFCPLQEKQLTRSECLDYSGEAAHFEECKNCETGLANKRLLCPPQTKV